MAVKTTEEYISEHHQWKEELSRLRKMLKDTGLEETIKWGAPAYTINGKKRRRTCGF